MMLPLASWSSKTKVAERVFNLSQIHAWVIYSITLIPWIHWSSDPFRENSEDWQLTYGEVETWAVSGVTSLLHRSIWNVQLDWRGDCDSMTSDIFTEDWTKMSHETQTLLFPVLLIFFTAGYTKCLEESCYQYRRKGNVTIDTDQCLWQNYTESKPKRVCLESCFENITVRI